MAAPEFDNDGRPELAPQDHAGVWIVWRVHGDRSQGFTTIYPEHEELEAMRQVNNDGFGAAEFIPFGVSIAG